MNVDRQISTGFKPIEFDGFSATCTQYFQLLPYRKCKLNKILAFNERRVLSNSGKVSKKAADEHARQEYEQFAERRRKHKEEIGEAESIKVLEDAAKQLEQKKPGDGK